MFEVGEPVLSVVDLDVAIRVSGVLPVHRNVASNGNVQEPSTGARIMDFVPEITLDPQVLDFLRASTDPMARSKPGFPERLAALRKAKG